MLIPVMGRAGSGKTTWVLEKVKEIAKLGQKILIVVPEQYSFEMEKAVYRALENQDAANVEVYSFTRLCHKLFSVFGGIAGETISEAAKQILMSLALDQARDELTLYSKPASSAAFVSSMILAVDEFKNAGVTPDLLHTFSKETENSRLSQKTEELGEIYKLYQAMIEASFVDEKDSLLRGCDLLRGQNFFNGYTIFIDSFMTFMAGELELIQLMLESCKALYLVMTANGINIGLGIQEVAGGEGGNATSYKMEDNTENGTFDIVKETTLHIISMAKQAGLPVLAPIKLDGSPRFTSPELCYLERCITVAKAEHYKGASPNLEIVRAATPYEEVQFVAAKIANLVSSGSLFYKDIAVIARTMEPYTTAIEDLFARYGLPFFMDLRQDIQSVPVVSVVLGALEAVRGNYDSQPLLALGKSPLLGLPCTDVAKLENYCYIWNINHGQWLDPSSFTNNPRGLVEKFTQGDEDELEVIRQTADLLVHPVQKLKESIHSCTGGQFAQAIYQFLMDIGARENAMAFSDMAGEAYDRYLTLNQGAWDILMDILDVFFTTMEKISLPQDRLIDLFRLGILTCDLGSIPNTLDQVSIGTADRMRPNKPKVTFVIGANQGEFPPQLAESGLFSDLERDELFQGGIRLNPSILKRSGYERFYLYSALTTASEQLIITSHDSLLTGESTPASGFILELEKCFPASLVCAKNLPQEFYIANERTAFDVLCRNLRHDNPFTAALIKYIRYTKYASRLDYVIAAVEQGSFRIHDKEISRLLFGEQLRLSPSKVENYFLCPFSYFCSGGLHLKARRKVEFSPLQSGTVIHFVLEKMVSRHGGKGLASISEATLQKEVSALLEEFLNNRVTQEEILTRRFRYLFTRLISNLTRLLIQLGEEFAQSEFEPYRFELPIRKDMTEESEVAPLELKTAEGVSICVEGIVDRIDLMEKEGVRYARVVDYKSGSKVFKLDDIYYGLNLQMLIYLFAIWENGNGRLENCLPAGVLYMPAKDHLVSASRDTPEEVIEMEHRKKYKMNGLLLQDPVCIVGMEEKAEGLFIPAKAKSDGSLDARSSVASLAQLGAIRNHVETILGEMAQSLSKGKIGAEPVEGLGYEPCQYCDFKTICRHQQDDPTRLIAQLGKQEFFDAIEGRVCTDGSKKILD